MDYIVDAWFRTGRQETLSPVVRDLVTVARDKFVHALSPLAANQSITGYGAIKDGHLNNPNPMLQPVDLPAGAWEMVSTRLHRTVTMCEERVGALWLGHPGESSKPQCSYSIAIDRANLIQLH